MDVHIRLAKESDLALYTKLLQKSYQETYIDERIGLTKECFSEKIFNSPDSQKYLASNLIVNDKQKAWLAFINNELVGAISIIKREDDYELRGFYVATKYQGRGIGKKLWLQVLQIVHDKDITCDLYVHNIKAKQCIRSGGLK